MNSTNILDSILITPLKKITAIIDDADKESAFDFLAWVYESLENEEKDYTAETEEDIIDLLIAMAEHYEPSADTNHYQEKLERRRERYEELAEKRQRESAQEWDTAHKMSSVIPFGQPILVGHHSERADRRYRDRIWDKMGKAVKLADTAKYHAARAARVGKTGISGDDPNKIIKLRRKLALAQDFQETMKAANKIAKSRKKNYTDEQKIEDLQALGHSYDIAVKIMTPDFAGRIGFASYQLTNNNAEIRRIQDRIDQEIANQKAANTPDTHYTMPNGDKVTVEFDTDDNRMRLHFPGKPDADTRNVLKRNGFKWSRYNMAWQRQITANARYSLSYVIKTLNMQPAN